jgi:hypothetical protein
MSIYAVYVPEAGLSSNPRTWAASDMPIFNAVNSANPEKITIAEGYKRWVRAQADKTPTDAKYHCAIDQAWIKFGFEPRWKHAANQRDTSSWCRSCNRHRDNRTTKNDHRDWFPDSKQPTIEHCQYQIQKRILLRGEGHYVCEVS